ncbi:MAG: type VI secretion system tip protein VgrG [Methylococcales bacterium]|nr:type VI secretion system tip protein VgrG [Methylococcales bacterium]
MSATTTINEGDLVTYAIKVEGTAVPESYQIFSIEITKAVNRISVASIVVLDGSADDESFEVSSSANFIPGNTLTIEAGYNNQNKLIFKGIVTKQNLRVDSVRGSTLTIECKDQASKMTVGRKNACFIDTKDSDVISGLIGSYSGLSSAVTATSSTLPQLVQHYSSDWDFMLSRAEVNGMVVSTINGKVSVFKPDANTSPVLTILYGNNMYRFDAELNSVTQLESVKASAWDSKSQQLITGQASNTLSGPGNLSSKTLAEVIGLTEFELQTTAAEVTADLTGWAKAQMLKSEFAKITGQTRFQGSALVEPGVYITIAGMGTRFNGDHLVSGVTHTLSDGNWFTEAQLGLSPQWFVQEPEVMAPPAAGLLPGIQGLYNATVKKIDADPDSAYRILINLPLFDPTSKGIWARLTNFYSTSGEGAFFLPEIGDEVIVGFLNDDPRYPIILGSLYSANRKPYSLLTPNAQNSHKAIVTKSELRIVFNDQDKVLTITTPAGNIIELDDKNKQIKVNDENGNSMVMSTDGISLKSPKNINIEADQKVSIKGKMGVEVESSGGDVSTSGLNIKENAQVEFNAKGSAQATIQGGATLTLKGGMVMIN